MCNTALQLQSLPAAKQWELQDVNSSYMQAVNIMALVPFRVSGAAADQTLEHRLFQIGQHTLRIDQDVHKSGSLQRVGIQHSCDASSGKES